MARESRPDSYLTLTVLSINNACGAAALLLAPVVVGGLVTTLPFSGEQAGYVISVELAGFALAAIPAALWIRRFNWQWVLYLVVSMMLVANLVTSGLQTLHVFLMVRFIAGFAAGLSMAVSMSVINLTRDPDRSLGYWFSLQLLLTVVGLALLPVLIGSFGVGAVYQLLAAFQVCILLVVRLVPSGGMLAHAGAETLGKPLLVLALLGFVSILLFEAAVMGLWTYYERIGNAGGLDMRHVGYALSVGNFFGFLGSLATAALSTRFGRLLPIAFGMGLAVVAITILRMNFDVAAFVFSASAFCFAWYFTLPYMMAAIANIDSSGRLLVFVNFVTGVGLTIGPAIAARLQTGGSYDLVIWMGIVMVTVAFILMIRLAVQPIRGAA